jgi:hypothetical protein
MPAELVDNGNMTSGGIADGLNSEVYPIQSLCYFCGSADKVKPAYTEAGKGITQ